MALPMRFRENLLDFRSAPGYHPSTKLFTRDADYPEPVVAENPSLARESTKAIKIAWEHGPRIRNRGTPDRLSETPQNYLMRILLIATAGPHAGRVFTFE